MSLTLKKSKTTNARTVMNMITELIQGAIFDMDGTLLDSMPVWEHASERYLQNQRNGGAGKTFGDFVFHEHAKGCGIRERKLPPHGIDG